MPIKKKISVGVTKFLMAAMARNEDDEIFKPGKGGDIALEELPPLVMGSVVLNDPAAILLDPV